MAEYDGEIRIKTLIENGEASSKLMQMESQFQKLAREASNVSEKMRELAKAKIPTEEYKNLGKQFDSLVSKGQNLSEKLKETEKYTPSKQYKEATKQLEELRSKLSQVQNRQEKFLATGGNKKSRTYKAMQYDVEDLSKSIAYVRSEIKDMEQTGEDKALSSKWVDLKNKMTETGKEAANVKAQMRELESSGKAYSDPTKTEEYKKLSNKLAGITDQQNVLNQKMRETVANEKTIGAGAKDIEKVGKTAKKSSGLISDMTKRIKQTVVSFAIFGAVMKVSQIISKSFTEGIQNMAKYSSEFNGKMSEMASAAATMKNSIGALTAPIISALTPAIVTLCTWLTNAINAINRFIAAISGKSTWTKAKKQQVDYAASLDKTASSAKKAAGALAAFDDLNVLQKNDSGSGSGGTSGASGSGYEEVPLTEKDFKWVDTVKNAFESMLPIVLTIGAALLTWKVASLLKDLLSMNSTLGTIVSWMFIIAGFALSIYSLFDMWGNGVDWKNLIGYIAGTSMAVGGLLALFSPFVAGIALIVLSVAGLIVALKDINENGLNTKNTCLLLVSAFGLIAGVFMAFGATAAIVVGGLLLIVAGIADLMEHGLNLKNGILIVSGVFLALSATVGITVAAIAAFIAGLVLAVAADWENFKKTVWEPMKKWGHTMLTNFEQLGNGIKAVFTGLTDFLKGVFTGDWKLVWTGLKTFFEGIWDAIVGCLKASVNLIVGALNTVYNAICGVINSCIEAINKINFTVPDWVPVLGGRQFGGFNIPKIRPVNIPYLANGGITTGSTLANIGEAGREAVLPLENNTGWMDDLASKLASKMPDYSGAKTVVLAVDGKEFARINLPYLQDEEIRLGIAEG
nr:MAG TPA: minor tail protein [Caudoviricetes sp.]